MFSIQALCLGYRAEMRKVLLSAAVFLACAAASQAIAKQGGWEIGPIIHGRSYSPGMPLYPTPTANGWSFDFPAPGAGHVDYVTTHPGPLAGASRITLRYRIEAAPGTRFVAQEAPQLPAIVSLEFQRAGDDWSARGAYESFRWYAPPDTVQALAPGEHEMTVSLADPKWISVYGHPAAENPQAFAAALAQCSGVSVVFGSASGRGHGVYATAPARFTLLDFRIS